MARFRVPLQALAVALAAPSTAQARDVARMEQVVEARTTGIAEGSRPLLDKGYGFADFQRRIPASPTTRVRLTAR